MRSVFILCLTFCWQLCSAQFSRSNFKYADKTLNTVAFRLQSGSLDTDEIRRIPQDIGMEFPYYISLGSLNLKFIHHEFFRIDTTRYFVREYFKGNFPPGKNVKSFGEEVIDKKVFDSVAFELFDPVCGDKIPMYMAAEHLLKKDGEWREFENSSSDSVFWRGNYLDDKKTGIWKRTLSFDVDTVLLGEIDYSKDSTKSIYVDNGIREKSLPKLKELLQGKWSGSSFYEGVGIIRFFKDSSTVYKCYLNPSQYLFNKSGKFIKQLPDGYYNSGEVLDRGTWRLRRRGDQTFIDLICDDGKKWEMELLNYSQSKGLFVNLNTHPEFIK